MIASGAHGLFAIGNQGESHAPSLYAKQRIMEIVSEEANGRVPDYAGTGAVSASETIALTTIAERIGASAASVIAPYFITPSPDELYEHYAAIARAVRLPILLYANPASDRRLHVGHVGRPFIQDLEHRGYQGQ